MQRKLRPFQAEDVDFIQANNFRVLVANAPGTGKTIEALAALHRERDKAPAIVVCPPSVVSHWRRESRKWCPWAKVFIVKDRVSEFPAQRVDIFIVPWSLLADQYVELLRRRPKLLIADEAHFAKSSESLRGQALREMAKRVPHILLLTGTPLINRHSELEGLRSLFGTEAPPMIRRLLEDVAKDIPPKRRCEIAVSLRSGDEAKYKRVEKDFSRWLEKRMQDRLDEGEAEAAAERAMMAEALVKIGYLRRILGVGKVYAAADWVGKMVRVGEPVVVFVEHQEVLRKLELELKKQRIRHVTIEGSTPRQQRATAIDLFQSGEVAVFLGTKAAKEGITLTRARNLLFVERYWTSAEEEQAEDRIRRIGQKHPTSMWFLHVPGTVDERVAAVIEAKRQLIRDAIGAADVEETPEKSVSAMVRGWGRFAEGKKAKTSELGHKKTNVALPSPNLVSHLLFSRRRWSVKSARIWARMTGYHTRVVAQSGTLIKVTNHSPALFEPGSFKVVRLSHDIRAVLGKRKTKRALARSTRRSKRARL